MRVTASRLPLAEYCLHWAREDAQWSRSESAAASHGLAAHAVAEAILLGRAVDVIDYEEIAEQALELREHGAVPEIAFAFDCSAQYSANAVRELGRSIGRNYRLEPSELAGTADAVWYHDGIAIVVDWKTGQQSELGPVGDNRQLQALGLMAARVAGCARARIGVYHVGHGWQWAELDELDLAAIEARLRALPQAIATARPNPGPWCASRYCPHVAYCESTQSTQLAPRDDSWPVVADAGSIESAAHAAWLLHRVEVVQRVAEQVRDALKEYADSHGGIQLADGSTWKKVEIRKEDIVAPSAEALIATLEPHCDASGLVEFSVAKGALEKAVKAHAEKGKGAEAWRKAIETLRLNGMIRTTTYSKHEVRK